MSLSGVINNAPNTLLLQWIVHQPQAWSGTIHVYFKYRKEPAMVLSFEKATFASYSQSFSENNSYPQGNYFSTILKGVTLKNVKLN
ncbi:type VI secretion system tube protein TssD [Sinomicrobium oceani]|uniref:type VI secretion system tube protein TssD n=1 Tax=Sinomicrobium oceani TaxID=1150368 RepID=UPI0011149754|nr:type VI secretion system tube protein TssD [Sinomicrobium oceani]